MPCAAGKIGKLYPCLGDDAELVFDFNSRDSDLGLSSAAAVTILGGGCCGCAKGPPSATVKIPAFGPLCRSDLA